MMCPCPHRCIIYAFELHLVCARTLWTPYSEPGKICSGPHTRELPEIMAEQYYFIPHSPHLDPSPRVPRVPASSYAGYLASIVLYYEGYGHPRRRSLIFRCIFN